MKRREFITLVGGAVAAWPHAARAQQPERMRRLGVLMAASEDDPLMQARITVFRQALAELGWTEGRNLKIEWRWTGGDITRVREYASELVRLAPDVLVANGTPNIAALKQATNSIPIVFVVVNDPVAQASLRAWRTRAAISPAFRSSNIRWSESRWRCSSRSRLGSFASP
jgi:putative ABC transport system substrate-binding protein